VTEPAFDMSEIIALYKEDARQAIMSMRAAWVQWADVVAGGPARQHLRKLSHQLRGSGRTYGFSDVTRISKAIENIMMKLEKKTLAAGEPVRLSLQKKIDRLAMAFKD
jgi:chemotaxis protein histidine kinase CheA